MRILILLLAAVAAVPAWPQSELPAGSRWIDHLNQELLPFWNAPTAFGDPFGAFPGSRCDDTTLYDETRPCAEIQQNSWISPRQRYLVSLSRQAYAYGVAFHLTGNLAYLDVMKAGIDFIRRNAIDRVNGGMGTTQNPDGSWIPAAQFRNPQELGYGLLGMAFYYYLTRDGDVLRDILAVKNYIFDNYYNPSLGAVQWLLESNGGDKFDDKHLVAQLDQMNTYLVLLTPLLPEPAQTEWKSSLLLLSHVMIDQFYSPADRLFFLSANKPEDTMLSTSGTDFGHNAKALWMIRWTGRITGDSDLVAFAEDNARTLFPRAYLDDCGCWAEGLFPGGTLDLDKSWWIYAELDQLAGTLALADPSFAQNLARTYDYWFSHFVDPVYGEVWNTVDGRTHAPVRQLPKQWQWKNAYHSFEHTLVGHIVAQQLHGEPVTLYYAFPADPPVDSLQPYYFSGTLEGIEAVANDQGRQSWKAVFSEVR
jgi:mannose/cellobiose epimerase-like protein (N-acyl-D-glucosamine 2-epimerase family)